MYSLSDKQIDFIREDIRSKGIGMEGLQQDLLDHVCCIIENDLEEEGDFGTFYNKTIRTFYKDALWEIEEETLTLLTFKNYYLMKKLMIVTGTFSAFVMIVGLWFKWMHYPGAGLFLPMGIFLGSLLFIPLLFTLKAKEQKGLVEKLVLATGALATMLISLSFVFKIMNWPHAMSMLYGSAAIMVFLFFPFYFFNGFREVSTRFNTIVISILIIMGYCLLFSLVRTPASERLYSTVYTHDFVRNEQILKSEKKLLATLAGQQSSRPSVTLISGRINELCEATKSAIIEAETGHQRIENDFENKNILLNDRQVNAPLLVSGKLNRIKDLVKAYNSLMPAHMNKIPVEGSFLQKELFDCYHVTLILNEIIQVQMYLLQNEYGLLARR